jgi:hypothetical protein
VFWLFKAPHHQTIANPRQNVPGGADEIPEPEVFPQRIPRPTGVPPRVSFVQVTTVLRHEGFGLTGFHAHIDRNVKGLEGQDFLHEWHLLRCRHLSGPERAEIKHMPLETTAGTGPVTPNTEQLLRVQSLSKDNRKGDGRNLSET